MDWPTSAHVIYIPVLLALGLVIGWTLGGRATRTDLAKEREREERRAQRKAEREAKRAEREAGS